MSGHFVVMYMSYSGTVGQTAITKWKYDNLEAVLSLVIRLFYDRKIACFWLLCININLATLNTAYLLIITRDIVLDLEKCSEAHIILFCWYYVFRQFLSVGCRILCLYLFECKISSSSQKVFNISKIAIQKLRNWGVVKQLCWDSIWSLLP